MNPLKKAKVFLPVLMLGVLPFIQDCRDPEIGPYPFEWIVNGASLTYDLHTNLGTFSNARTLEVSVGTGRTLPPMIFEEHGYDQTNDPYRNRLLLGMFSDVLAKPDGLYTARCNSCNMGACWGINYYVKVPYPATPLQNLPNYACGETIDGYEVVISEDSVVHVPLGEFETVVIVDTLTSTVKFWNEKNGLIRVDNFSKDFPDTLKLMLAKKNF